MRHISLVWLLPLSLLSHSLTLSPPTRSARTNYKLRPGLGLKEREARTLGTGRLDSSLHQYRSSGVDDVLWRRDVARYSYEPDSKDIADTPKKEGRIRRVFRRIRSRRRRKTPAGPRLYKRVLQMLGWSADDGVATSNTDADSKENPSLTDGAYSEQRYTPPTLPYSTPVTSMSSISDAVDVQIHVKPTDGRNGETSAADRNVYTRNDAVADTERDTYRTETPRIRQSPSQAGEALPPRIYEEEGGNRIEGVLALTHSKATPSGGHSSVDNERNDMNTDEQPRAQTNTDSGENAVIDTAQPGTLASSRSVQEPDAGKVSPSDEKNMMKHVGSEPTDVQFQTDTDVKGNNKLRWATVGAKKSIRRFLGDPSELERLPEFMASEHGINSLLNLEHIRAYDQLSDRRYRVYCGSLKLLSWYVEPVLDLEVRFENGSCILETRSCEIQGKSPKVREQNRRFKAWYRYRINWGIDDSAGGKAFLQTGGELEIQLQIYTFPFTKLPLSAVQAPGNKLMQALLRYLLPAFLDSLLEDFTTWRITGETARFETEGSGQADSPGYDPLARGEGEGV